MERWSENVAEVIPYGNFKQRIRIINQEEQKGRYVEIWDGVIYSAMKLSELRRC